VTDHGDGAVSLLAVRGNPRRLFNVHLDTVPDSPGWSADPWRLRVEGDRAIGLGSCDIKGAAAGLLAAAAATTGDAAFLFGSDEEANDARCIPGFLATAHGFDEAIVAEPTRCEAVLAHRGIGSVLVRFRGEAGHASAAGALEASALHQAVRWGANALALVEGESHRRFGGLTGLRFNIGRIEGGIKANMIAPSAHVRFGMRPLPTMDPDQLLTRLRELVEPQPAEFAETFRGPSLPAGDTANAEANRLAARDLADELAIPVGNAVDFWTEAALFSAAGYTAFVYGPGDIAQAHSADEWVALDQLQQYVETIHRIVSSGNA
jgi:acetylornithine deacetylase